MDNQNQKQYQQKMILNKTYQVKNSENQLSEGDSLMEIQDNSSEVSYDQIDQQINLSQQDKHILRQTKTLGMNFNHLINQRDQFSSLISGALGKFFNSILNNLTVRANQKSKQSEYLQQQENLLIGQENIQNKEKTQTKNIQKQQNLNQQNKLIPVKKTKKINKDKDEGQNLIKNMQQKYDFQLKNNRLYMKGMPKKPVSSFFFFFKQQSKKVQQVHENKQDNKQSTYGSVLAKCISQKWANMTAEQKLPYEKLSQQTRDKYKQQMEDFKFNNKEVYENFKKIKRIKANQARKRKNRGENNQLVEQQNSDNQSNQQNKGQLIQQEEELPIMIPEIEQNNKHVKQQSKPYKGKFKSQHKPKSPVPSFFFFYNQRKQQIGRQNNVKTGAQIAKFASQIWKQMTEQQKKSYEQMAENKRKQYYQEMKRFQIDYPQEYALMIKNKKRNRSKNKAEQQVAQSQSQQQGSIQSLKDSGKKQNGYKAHRPKAPVSSFFIFYKQNNAALAQKCKQQPSLKLAQYASAVWKKMSTQQKRPYEQRSNESRKLYYKQMQEYRQKYPDQIIQRKQDLKKKHKKEALNGKRQRTQAKNEQSQESQQEQLEAIQNE